MKNFLLLSVFAMVSAGIYGFADMSNDIAKGKMIDYQKVEAERAKQKKLDDERLERERVLANELWVSGNKTVKPDALLKSQHDMTSKPRKVKHTVKVQPEHQIRFRHFSRGDFEEERAIVPSQEQSENISTALDSIAPNEP